jgi:MEMO1 family protein
MMLDGPGRAQRLAWFFACAVLGSAGCSRARARPEPAPLASAQRVRQPAVAGAFYPDSPDALRTMVDGFLAGVAARGLSGLRALVCPHAGYRYSGPVAASGFKQIAGRDFDQVVVMAPSHHVPFHGVALPDVDAFGTPLGTIPVAARARELVGQGPFVLDSTPHQREHALEVELPFLQRMLGRFELVPLVFGAVDEAEVARRLDKLVGPRTLVVASSDLSHYHPYARATELDRSTVDAIVRLDVDALEGAEACGKGPVLALVQLARLRGWKAELLDYRNSGDTAGDRSRVVGYAAIAFRETAQ